MVALGVASAGLAACSFETYDDAGCAESFAEAVDDGTLPSSTPVDDAEVSFQGVDDWEGGTPVCWATIETDATCELFMFDIQGTWAVDQWIATDSVSGPCGT